MLELIENHRRNVSIIREEFDEFKIDVYFSNIFKQTSPDLKNGLESFYSEKIKGLIPNEGDIFVFCFNDYSKLGELIDELEKKGHTDIKKSDIYIYEDNKIHKI